MPLVLGSRLGFAGMENEMVRDLEERRDLVSLKISRSDWIAQISHLHYRSQTGSDVDLSVRYCGNENACGKTLVETWCEMMRVETKKS